MPGPSRTDVNESTLHRTVDMTHNVSTRVSGGWHDGPPGPFLAHESAIVQSEQTQRGKLSPKLGREVEERRAKAVAKDETLDLVRVPPPKAIDHVRQRRGEIPQVDVPQCWRVPCLNRLLQFFPVFVEKCYV